MVFSINLQLKPTLNQLLNSPVQIRAAPRAARQLGCTAAPDAQPSPFSAALAAHRLWALSGLPPHLQRPNETLASALRRAAELQLNRPSRQALAHAFSASIAPSHYLGKN